jgi:hypothetical protein
MRISSKRKAGGFIRIEKACPLPPSLGSIKYEYPQEVDRRV